MNRSLAIDPRLDALLIIDLQLDFLPGGALPVEGGDEIVAPIAELSRRFSTVIATQDFHPPRHVSFASRHDKAPLETVVVHGERQLVWPDHCVAGTPGAALHPSLPDEAITLILRKGTRPDVDSYSAFRESPGPEGHRASTGLGAYLRARGIERVFACGLARDVCVRASCVDAAREGFTVWLLEDLTRAIAPGRDDEVDRALDDAGVQGCASGDLR